MLQQKNEQIRWLGRWWLPNNRRKEEKEVRKSMDNLRNQLISIDSQTNNINVSIDNTIKKQHQQRLMLEQKGNKTEDEIKLLQSLVYLEENHEKAKEIYKKEIEINNNEQKYWALWQIVRWWLLSALGELWWWVTWKNADIADIYKDIKWYWWFDLSDENAKIAWDLAWDILEEVIVLAVAAAVWVATAWIWSTAIIRAETAAISAKRWAKGIKVTKYIAKLTNKLTKPIWKIIKKTGNYVKTSKPWKYIAKTAERAQNTRLWKNLNKIRLEQNNARIAESQANRAKMLELWEKENKTLWEMYKLWTLANKEWSMWIKAVAAIFEWTWFHISSTVIHNAINWAELNTWLNPFGYTEWPNWEKISNFKWYVQSIAFLKILKTIGQPIQNLTQASLTSALWEKISANTFWKILQSIGSITWEFWTLTVTDEAINVIFEWELKELTVQDAVHTIGIILWLRAYWKIKQITSLKIKEYNRNKKELKVEINGKDIVVNEDMLDKQIEKNKESNKSKEEEIKAKEEEINNLKKKISGIENRLKEINEKISEIETNREISNNKIVANHISERRTKSNNGNNPSENIKINEHYDWKIIDGEIKIIDKRTWKETKIKFDAKKKINKLLWNDKELEKLDFEIAQRMILGIKYGHIEVEGIEEAMKIIEWYPKMNLEIVGLENGNYWVRRKTNIRELRQKKSELDEQLKWLKSNQRKKTIELNKMKKEQDSNNVEQEPKDDNVEQEAKDDNVEQEVKKDNGEQESRRQDIGKETEWEKWWREELNEVDNIEKNLEQLVTETRTENLDNIKLDRVTKAMFEGSVYFEWLSRFFKKSKTLPKKFIKKVWDNLTEMKNKCRESLSEAKKQLVNRWNKFFEKKLSEEWDVIEVREEEIKQIEEEIKYTKDVNWNILPENYEKMSAEELIQEYQNLKNYEDNWTLRLIGRSMSWKVQYLNSHDCSTQKAKIREILEKKFNLNKEGNPLKTSIEEIQEIESIDGDILSNLWIKDITKKEMDIIQNILKNSELHNIFKKYLETWFIVREWIDKNTTIEQINKEIENIEKTISTIEWSKSNLLKIKNILFYVKQNILWRNISNLSWYQKRILATERSRYQTAINDICKRYTKLSKISENIIITEECDLKIIEQSLKDINLLPESTLQKIKDNWITIFLWDKTVTNRWFKNNLRWVHPRWRPEWRTRDEVWWLASWKIAIAWRWMRNWKYYSSIESSTWSPSMILHELWHTFDHCTIWDLSRTQEFIEFHKKLYDKLSSYEQQWWPWWEAWCSEFFAESTAQFFKRWEKKFKKYYWEEYYEYIKKQLVW